MTATVTAVSAPQAKKLAILAPLLALSLSLVADVATNKLGADRTSRTIAGAMILMLMLALLAEASPSIAAGFAWLVIVTALFVTGDPAWSQLSKLTRP